jgi:hypothetical protein
MLIAENILCSVKESEGSVSILRTVPISLFLVMKDLKYADTHEWVKVEGDSATVGITDHAQVNTFVYSYYCEVHR